MSGVQKMYFGEEQWVIGEEWIIGAVFVAVGVAYFVVRGFIARLEDGSE